MKFGSGSRILLTGGTGSFGKAFIAEVLCRFPDISRLVIYSRDELKQWELLRQYPEDKFPQLRFFLGDVRDRKRLKERLRVLTLPCMQQHSSKCLLLSIIRWNLLILM